MACLRPAASPGPTPGTSPMEDTGTLGPRRAKLINQVAGTANKAA